MSSKTILLLAILSVAAFVAIADDIPALQLKNYTMTFANYISLSNDTQFATDYSNYSMNIYSQLYYIAYRNRKFSSGNLTFTVDVNQTTTNQIGTNTIQNVDIRGTVMINNNVVTGVDLPDLVPSPETVDAGAIRKVITAYVNFVALGAINYQIALTEQWVNVDVIKTWNPNYNNSLILVPDIKLKVHDFYTTFSESSGVKGTITFQIDAYSEFLSYTPRYRGKVLTFFGVPVTITLNGDVNAPVVTIDPKAIKPYPLADVTSIVTQYYLGVALPLIKNLFALN